MTEEGGGDHAWVGQGTGDMQSRVGSYFSTPSTQPPTHRVILPGQATTFQQSVETCALGHDKTSGTVEINKWNCLQCWYNDIQMLLLL